MDPTRELLTKLKQDYPTLPAEEQIKMAEEYKKTGDPMLKEYLVLSNARMIIPYILKYRSRESPMFEDLFNEGIMGLMTAVDRYDSSFGTKFSTYASYWIEQAISRYLLNHEQTIRLPVHQQEKYYKIKKFIDAYREEHMGNMPTISDIVEGTDLPENVIFDYLSKSKTVSLNTMVTDDQDVELESLIEDTSINVESSAIKKILNEDLLRELENALTPKEMEVISRRFGLRGANTETLQEIGQDMNLTRERIRQIEEIAIKKLRRNMNIRKIALDENIKPRMGRSILRNNLF